MVDENRTPQEVFEAGVRRIWHNGEWYYAIVDVIEVLTNSLDPSSYWRNLKRQRLAKDEQAAEALESIIQLRLQARDKRFRLTDMCNRKALLRFIQSISSPRAEPFKVWLAQIGDERIAEIENPELAIQRVRGMYHAKGYDDQWIEERIRNDLIRNELTDEWKSRGAQDGTEYAILTNEIHTGTFEISVQAHKKYKLLPSRENLRNHMTPIELALLSLSEASCVEFHRDRDSQEFSELRRDAVDAGEIGGDARKMIEQRMKKRVVSFENHLDKQRQRKVSKGRVTEARKLLPQPDQTREEPGEEPDKPEQGTLI